LNNKGCYPFISAVALHFTNKAPKELETKVKDIQFGEEHLKREAKYQSGPAPKPPQMSSPQPTSTPPGTIPLGAERRDLTATKIKDLRNGM
jgi:hypothetical protein